MHILVLLGCTFFFFRHWGWKNDSGTKTVTFFDVLLHHKLRCTHETPTRDRVASLMQLMAHFAFRDALIWGLWRPHISLPPGLCAASILALCGSAKLLDASPDIWPPVYRLWGGNGLVSVDHKMMTCSLLLGFEEFRSSSNIPCLRECLFHFSWQTSSQQSSLASASMYDSTPIYMVFTTGRWSWKGRQEKQWNLDEGGIRWSQHPRCVNVILLRKQSQTNEKVTPASLYSRTTHPTCSVISERTCMASPRNSIW